MKLNLISASHDLSILRNNLMLSLMFQKNPGNVVTDYKNVSAAYNFADIKCNPLLDEYNVYVHHDVFLPPAFEYELKKAVMDINSFDKNWGVLGVAGVILEKGVRKIYGHVRDRGTNWGSSARLPREVQTLDELILITKGDFKFDEQFDLHFYGADICMQAQIQGRKNYAISAYCHHNSGLTVGYRSDSFRECEAKFKHKWEAFLPIVTTCALIK